MTEAMDDVMHSLKCWPEPFEAMLRGDKTAEFRYNDRGFQVGDRLRIQEWCPQSETYTGREIVRVVSHVLSSGYGIPEGYAMLSLAKLAPADAREGLVDLFSDQVVRDILTAKDVASGRERMRLAIRAALKGTTNG